MLERKSSLVNLAAPPLCAMAAGPGCKPVISAAEARMLEELGFGDMVEAFDVSKPIAAPPLTLEFNRRAGIDMAAVGLTGSPSAMSGLYPAEGYVPSRGRPGRPSPAGRSKYRSQRGEGAQGGRGGRTGKRRR